MTEKPDTERVEEQAADDPTRYEERSRPPAGEDSGDERAEKVAGEDRDPSDEESYEGGLPA